MRVQTGSHMCDPNCPWKGHCSHSFLTGVFLPVQPPGRAEQAGLQARVRQATVPFSWAKWIQEQERRPHRERHTHWESVEDKLPRQGSPACQGHWEGHRGSAESPVCCYPIWLSPLSPTCSVSVTLLKVHIPAQTDFIGAFVAYLRQVGNLKYPCTVKKTPFERTQPNI